MENGAPCGLLALMRVIYMKPHTKMQGQFRISAGPADASGPDLYNRLMTRAEAIEILNLEPETTATRYTWPTGQLVMHARKALRPARLPSVESLEADLQAAEHFLRLADAAEARRLSKVLAQQTRRAHAICDEDVAKTLAITTRPPARRRA